MDNLYGLLAASAISSSINNSTQSQQTAQRILNQNIFIGSNTACLIKDIKKVLVKTHFFKENEYKYYLKCQGLSIDGLCDVLVNQSLFECSHPGQYIIFKDNKNELDLQVIKNLNPDGCIVSNIFYRVNDALIRVFGKNTNIYYNLETSRSISLQYKVGETVWAKTPSTENNTSDSEQPLEDTWYGTRPYNTFDIEDLITNSKNNFLFAYIDFDTGSPIFTDEEPQNKIFINNLDDNILYVPKSGEPILDYMDSQTEISEEIKEQARKLLMTGCIRIKIPALRKYPVQTRQHLCNLYNIAFIGQKGMDEGCGLWFEQGQHTHLYDLK